MNMDEIIRNMEQAIEDERDELNRLGLLTLEQDKKICENARIFSQNRNVDEMLWTLHLLKRIRERKQPE